MLKVLASAAVAVSLVTLIGCSSTPERGPAENAAATAGRVVDDSIITGRVKAALIADPTTKAHQITVETFNGTVQLSGFVDDAKAKARAVQVAKEVEGVREVKDDMELRHRS